jgi:4'-phosphopantetheinyl transferase
MEHQSGGPPALSRGVIHVWSACLAQPPSILSAFLPTLSPDERERAARCDAPEPRQRFIVARGLLRSILGDYLEIPPARVEFSYGPSGKPSLSRRLPTRTLTFSVSHCDDQAMYAVGVGRAVGIDVERVRPLLDAEKAVPAACSAREQSAIARAPAPAHDELLFAYWTCKEAYTKARGDRLARPLADIEVALDQEGRAQFTRIDGSEREAGHWRVERLTPAPGYVGALVVEGFDWVHAQLRALPR